MAFNKITNADTTGKGVVGLPDVPGLSTGAMQQKFDELALDVIIPKFNDVVDGLNGTGVATDSQMTDPVDGTTKSVQATANSLKAYVDTRDNTKADKATTLAGYNISDAYTKTEADTLLAGKADNATTLAGYGITDAYTKTETDNALATKADKATTLAGYGITNAYTKTETDTALSAKADKATTLAGYGITDAYTKTQADNLLAGKVDKVAGKGLSTNDYDGTEKANVAANTAARHTHTNKSVLDAITSFVKSGYDSLVTLFTGITGVETSITNSNAKMPTSGAVVSYVSSLGGGDMLKSVYDTNDDGTVDSADTASTALYADAAGDSSKLGGSLPSYYAASGDLQTLFGDVATYQSTATALRNYAVGDFMVYQNNFYEVTQAIASGGTIVPNTNVTKTTVGAVLSSFATVAHTGDYSDLSGTGNVAVKDANNQFSENQTVDKKNGTTLNVGETYLYIGNSTPTGTDGNSRGNLMLYGNASYTTKLRAPNSTANRDIKLPDADGNLALREIDNNFSATQHIDNQSGTISTVGVTNIIVGNNKASGTDKNSRGQLLLFGNGSNYGLLRAQNVTATREYELPDKSGTVALTSDLEGDTEVYVGADTFNITLKRTPAMIMFRPSDNDVRVIISVTKAGRADVLFDYNNLHAVIVNSCTGNVVNVTTTQPCGYAVIY